MLTWTGGILTVWPCFMDTLYWSANRPVLQSRGDLASATTRSSQKPEYRADVRQTSRFLPFYELGHGSLYEMYFDVY
jgi:hypothetical protein